MLRCRHELIAVQRQSARFQAAMRADRQAGTGQICQNLHNKPYRLRSRRRPSYLGIGIRESRHGTTHISSAGCSRPEHTIQPGFGPLRWIHRSCASKPAATPHWSPGSAAMHADALSHRFEDKTLRCGMPAPGGRWRCWPPIGDGSLVWLYAAALSPDGSTIAAAGNFGFDGNAHTLYLFDRATGQIRKGGTLNGLEAPVHQLVGRPMASIWQSACAAAGCAYSARICNSSAAIRNITM